MAEPKQQILEVGEGAARRRIACLTQPPAQAGGLGFVWLSGFKSDMVSTKASALAEWSSEHGHGCTRFDYSGHGQSGGRFEDCTLSDWLEEAVEAFTRLTAGPQIIVGSSMGGHIALLLLRRLLAQAPAEAARIKALCLIAPAWDMTEELMWKEFPETVRREIEAKGVWMRPSQYGDPYPITKKLIEDGRRHLLAKKPFDPGRPVHIIHGLLDPDVPWEHTLELESFLEGGWTRVSAVPDGEHRLSRPEDLELLFSVLEGLALGAAG